MIFGKSKSQKIKTNARKTLNGNVSSKKGIYVVDTSAIINKFLPNLVEKGLNGKIIVPNAVMAELEHLANKGLEIGFMGLEEISFLHTYKNIKLKFEGLRPGDSQIKYAKSGAIDAIIRDIASKNKAFLITADLVQAKSAQAYGLNVIFLKPEIQKKSFFSRFKIFKQ